MVAGSSRRTQLLSTATGQLEYLVVGSGEPVTVFAHGLAASIDSTRPLGMGVAGTQGYFHFRGHGGSPLPQAPWSYSYLADDLEVVAGHLGATQALGVSMGAGALCHLLERDPARFDKIVLVLPSVLDRPRTDPEQDRLIRMARLADEGELAGLADEFEREQPPQHRGEHEVRAWALARAEAVLHTGAGRALRELPHQAAMHDRRTLARVQAPALVIAQRDDPAHPISVAAEIAELLPRATLRTLPPGGLVWSHRSRVRTLIGEFLS